MHKFLLLLFILLALNSPINTNAQCSDTPQPSPYNCVGTPTPITGSSLPSMISGSKQYLYLMFCACIANTCGVSGVIHYLTLGLITGGVERKALEITFNQGTNRFEFTTKFDYPSDILFGTVSAWAGLSLQNSWIEFYGSVAMTGASAATVISGTSSGVTMGQASAPSSVSYYDDVKIYVGSALNNLNPVSVEIQDLRVDYFTGGQPWLYLGGLSATLLAYYQLNEGTGTILTDSQGGLGTAYLGSSMASASDTDSSHLPIWELGGPGIDFTANTQYITLPNFIPQAANPVTPASLSVAFWLKLSTVPAADGYIFRHSNSMLNFDNFACQVIGGLRRLKVILGNTLLSFTNSIIVGSDWTYVYIHLALKLNLQQWFSSLYTYGGTSVYTYNLGRGVLPTPFSFPSSGVVRLGGPSSFIGKIAHFKIFSPGSIAFNQGQTYAYYLPVCIVSSLLQIGAGTPTQPGLATQETCAGTCSQCFNSQPTGCLACTGTNKLYNSTCVSSCTPGSYTYNSAFCIDCPPGCVTCTDALTCQSCKSGFALVGSLCPCHSTCKTCTNNQPNGCLTCYPGDNLYKSQCLASCPRGTYAVDSVCLDCPNSCPLCDDYGNCLVPSIVTQSVGIRDVIQTVVQGTILASSFVLGGGYGRAVSISVLSKMTLYIRYINVSYSDQLLYALQNWASSFFSVGSLINMPGTVENDVPIYKQLPGIFIEYGVHPSFLNNYWDDILIFAFTIAILSCLLILEFTVLKSYKVSLFAYIKKARVKTLNLLLTLLYEGYGDIIFFSVMEFRSMDLRHSYTTSSFCLSFLFILIGLAIFALHIYFLYKHQKHKNNKTAKANKDTISKKESTELKSNKHEGIQEFFLDFKDRTFIQQAFLLIFVFRDILFNLTLTNSFEKPLAEAGLLVTLSVLMLMYLITNRSLESFLELTEIILYEIILLVVNILVLIMASQDAKHILDITSRQTMCWIIIYISISLNFVPLLFTFINLVLKIRDVYKKRRARKKQQNLKPSQTPRLQVKTNVKNSTIASYLDAGTGKQLMTRVIKNDVSIEYNPKLEKLENSDASLINDSFMSRPNLSLNSPLKGLNGEIDQTSSYHRNDASSPILQVDRFNKQAQHRSLVSNINSVHLPEHVPVSYKGEINSRKEQQVNNSPRVIKEYTRMDHNAKISNLEHKDAEVNNGYISQANLQPKDLKEGGDERPGPIKNYLSSPELNSNLISTRILMRKEEVIYRKEWKIQDFYRYKES